MTAVALKRNVPGYIDELGRFRPIRSASFVGSGSSRRPAKAKDRKKYSRAKGGDLGKLKQERALEDPWDTELRLKREAAEHTKREQARIEKQIAAEAFGDTDRTSRGKAKSLAQFVRGEGGIRRTFRHGGTKFRGKRSSWDAGEIDRLSPKESGTTGLTTSQAGRGKTMDKMFQAAREAGYDVGSPDEMMQALESEIYGGKATYATGGYMAYNPRKMNPAYRTEQIGNTLVLRNRGKQIIHRAKFTSVKAAKAAFAELVRDGLIDAKGIRIVKTNPIKILKHKFYVGQKLATRSIGDHEVIYRGTVVSRTPKFVTVKIDGDRELKRCGVSVFGNSEVIYPLGKFSMAPTFRAEKGDRVGNPSGSLFDAAVNQFRHLLSKGLTVADAKRWMKNNWHLSYLDNDDLTEIANAAQRRNPTKPSASQLAKAAISVFDNDLDLDVDARDVRRLQRGEKAVARKKKNPDVLGMFANAAVGVASALQIKEYMNRPKRKTARKTNGTTTAKRRKTALRKPARSKGTARKNPTQASLFVPRSLNVLTVRTGERVDAVYLHDGKTGGFGKKFKTLSAAKSFATRNKIKLVENPSPKVNGVLSRALARAKAKREYGRELRAEAAAARARPRRQKAESKAKANPNIEIISGRKYYGNHSTGSVVIVDGHPAFHGTTTEARKFFNKLIGKPVKKQKGITVVRGSKLTKRKRRRSTVVKKVAAARRNPKTTARRRTYEMFQGRRATKATPMQVSRHAPARLDALGDLVAIKIAGGPEIKLNGKHVKLCAANGKLWIAGKRFAKPNPKAAANEINPIGEIAHVVYGTYKPHHGDHNYTHYIHKLGEESGVRPVLCVDREGFPVIRGGNYKIEARGIVD